GVEGARHPVRRAGICYTLPEFHAQDYGALLGVVVLHSLTNHLPQVSRGCFPRMSHRDTDRNLPLRVPSVNEGHGEDRLGVRGFRIAPSPFSRGVNGL